ncbi:hypothetical protein [Streptomyces sp. NPDC001999]
MRTRPGRVVHRFGEIGLAWLRSGWAGGRLRRFDDDGEAFVVAMVVAGLARLGEPFAYWSVRELCICLCRVRDRVILIGREVL